VQDGAKYDIVLFYRQGEQAKRSFRLILVDQPSILGKSMASDSLSLGRKDNSYRSLTQIIVELIRQEIYEGTYKPGARLNIADLAQRFQASAVPVREALRNLEAEGLVEFRPNRGVVIRDLSAREVRELFLMRLPLELLAATQAALHGDDAALDAIDAILKRMDAAVGTPDWHVLHDRFHHEFYSLSQLPRLIQYVGVLRGQMRPYAKLYLSDPRHVEMAQAEHYLMVEAARARDPHAIRPALVEHLRRPAHMALSALGFTDLDKFDQHFELVTAPRTS
jgi:DNA-binding GntR family transcriptional regulator